MVESIILLLIYICLVVGVCWLVIFVLGQLGVPLPPPSYQNLLGYRDVDYSSAFVADIWRGVKWWPSKYVAFLTHP